MQKPGSSFFILISVFFFWGFVAASNDILIPVFKEKLHLEQWQSQMISFAFYVAYTIGSIIYVLLSKANGSDILNKIGYKNGIALGLVISAIGTLLFYPAAQSSSFSLMISGLFIVGLGFSLQQTAANPLAITIGDPKKGAQRLSMAGGINNIGTTIGPLVISFAIFGSIAGGVKLDSIEAVKTPYLILGLAFIIVAIIFKFSSLPNKIEHKEEINSASVPARKSALAYPQLVLGMIAIFIYVGVEVSTASNLPEFMRQHAGISTEGAAPYVSLFWASLMIGRWTGAVQAFDLKKGFKHIARFLMPYLAFGVFLLVNKIANKDLTPFYLYVFVIVVMIAGDILSKGNPARQLLIFSLLGIAALFVGIFADGMISVYSFISVGLFCSTLWPCIFTLAIAGLGKFTNQGSSYLIMMIMGGGFISLFQGWLAGDNLLGIQWSYLVGVMCFAYLAFYGWKASSILRSQGIDYDTNTEIAY
ncbi:MAG TPA: MFS transporter [Bacteroidia bacterium]|jgi:FHS family L-fucose permease-like MFS transporter|nr:MFS transporter [Bacteroidia bacterium]